MSRPRVVVDTLSPYHDGSMQYDEDGGFVSIEDYLDLEKELQTSLEQQVRYTQDVDRVEVIGSDNRLLTLHGVTSVKLDIQDNGRTLKVFLKEKQDE